MISPQPYNYALAITKSDTVDLPKVNGTALSAIFVGTAGTVILRYGDGSTVTLAATIAGTILNVTCIGVGASTGASNLLALYQL